MGDYNFDVGVLRGKMADELASNTEQLAFVLTNALSKVDADNVIDEGEMGDEADPELVVHNLRMLAEAIENGTLT